MKKVLLLSLLIAQPVFAEYVVSDIIAGCNDLGAYRAVFMPIPVTCAPGYYLPANALRCEICPSGYTCNGGTYDFNQDEFSGATYTTPITDNMNNICASNAPIALRSVFNPKTIHCDSGKYLPANSIDCNATCLINHYCPGGNVQFSETNDGGIFACENPTPFAPIGSSFCYEHILHIDNDVVYLKSTKTTTPSLNIGMDDGIFYANMTTTPTPMNAGTERYLKIEYDGVIYYVCDDTTYGK